MFSLQTLISATAVVYRHVMISLIGNIIDLFASLPLLILAGIVILLLHPTAISPTTILVATLVGVVVLPNPGSAGIQYVMHDLANGDFVTLGDLWTGYRLAWLPALRLWVTGLVILAVILANLAFYPVGPLRHVPIIVLPLELILISILTLWAEVHLYVYPLIFRQEHTTVLLTYRNALVLVLQRPMISLAVTLSWIVIMALLTGTGISSVLGLALGASIQQTAAARLIKHPARPEMQKAAE